MGGVPAPGRASPFDFWAANGTPVDAKWRGNRADIIHAQRTMQVLTGTLSGDPLGIYADPADCWLVNTVAKEEFYALPRWRLRQWASAYAGTEKPVYDTERYGGERQPRVFIYVPLELWIRFDQASLAAFARDPLPAIWKRLRGS